MNRRRKPLVGFLSRAALRLLLGVTTTVAIAWVLAYTLVDAEHQITATLLSKDHFGWIDCRTSGGITAVRISIYPDLGLRRPELRPGDEERLAAVGRQSLGALAAMKADELLTHADVLTVTRLDGRGWPWPCLWYERSSDPTGRRREMSVFGGIEIDAIHVPDLSLGSINPLALPYRPLWPAFCGDTAVYTGAWALILFAPGAVRRGLRARNDRCLHCDYDLKATPADAPCPECGHARKTSKAPAGGVVRAAAPPASARAHR